MNIGSTRLTRFGFAVAIAVLVAAAPARTAWADDFGDACVAGGGGMFEAKDCTCMADKIASDEDRATLIAFFQASADADKNGTKPDENDPQLKKGFALLNDYLGKCMK
ncbi:MAG TPA: hypothetical protein VGP42_15420 [Stellaceae bacterium]|jgi:hypothetical protein|nr:hypothetical protein [Stellaceae bacterium]